MQAFITDTKDSTRHLEDIRIVAIIPEQREKFADRITITPTYCEVRVNDKLTKIEF